MKRIKLFMLSAAIVAAGSAFVPAEQPPGDTYVKVGSSFLLKSTQTGRCLPMDQSACNYVLKDGHSPNVESDFIFDINDDEYWQPQ